MKQGLELSGLSILVVEDQYMLATDVAQALRNAGARVLGPVPDLEAGLALVRQNQLDAAVLDVNLQGEMSFAIADILRERGIPFLFATGYGGWALPARYQDVKRLEKPFDYRALVPAISALLPSVAMPDLA